MRSDLDRFVRWLRRARPPRRDLARALTAGLVASTTNVALLVGAVALLVVSAPRPGLHAVLGPLIVIELFAFLRSPLRFAERMSAHQLGFDAVTSWRRWLVATVGRLDYSQWRAHAAGDLLERALRDTDELQDLWLRCVIPLVTTLSVAVLGDAVVAVLAPRGQWWPVVAVLGACQVLGVAALVANVRPLLADDRALRRARGAYRAELVELSAVTPDLVLLGRVGFAASRSLAAVHRLLDAERTLRRRRQFSSLVPLAASLGALTGLAWRPATSPVWIVVAAMLALATADLLATVRSALDTAVAVAGGAERLEELDCAAPPGNHSWPRDATLRLEGVTLMEDGTPLAVDVSLRVAAGRRVAVTGASGAGKSTLLRAMAALDRVPVGRISVGGIALDDLDEGQLRREVAYVPSDPGLIRGYAIDVVQLGRATLRDAVNDLEALGISTDRTTRFQDLSRGETERVAIARALVTTPSIYLLDEPTGGLGREETARVLTLVGATGATVVVATHDPQVIEWCDDVVELRDGSLREVNR